MYIQITKNWKFTTPKKWDVLLVEVFKNVFNSPYLYFEIKSTWNYEKDEKIIVEEIANSFTNHLIEIRNEREIEEYKKEIKNKIIEKIIGALYKLYFNF